MGTIRSRCALEDSKRPSWPRWTGDKTGTPHDRSRPRARGVRTTGRGGVFRLRVENSHLPMDRIHSGVCEASRSRAGPCHSSERILPDIGRPLRRRVRGGFSPPSVPPRESRRRTDQDGLDHPFRRTTTNKEYTRMPISVDTRSLGQVSSFDRLQGVPRTSRPRKH